MIHWPKLAQPLTPSRQKTLSLIETELSNCCLKNTPCNLRASLAISFVQNTRWCVTSTYVNFGPKMPLTFFSLARKSLTLPWLKFLNREKEDQLLPEKRKFLKFFDGFAPSVVQNNSFRCTFCNSLISGDRAKLGRYLCWSILFKKPLWFLHFLQKKLSKAV